MNSLDTRLAVIAPCYYLSMWPVRYLAGSADRHRVHVQWYGLGQPYTSWTQVQITDLLPLLLRLTDATHVLYTDASDAILLTNLDEIAERYHLLGSPEILISEEQDGVCAGGWMAERKAAWRALRVLQTMDIDTTNPQTRWRAAIADGSLSRESLQVVVDRYSAIFQVTGPRIEVVGSRIYNVATGQLPCVLHFAGGYTSPTIGKADQIEPLWRALGYPATVRMSGETELAEWPEGVPV